MSDIVEIPFKAEGPAPLLRDPPPPLPFPLEALGPLQSPVRAVQDMTQAPAAIAAQSALSVASLAVQGFANVETLGGDAPCSLFCMTIAVSGERKSSCDGKLMKGLQDFERHLGELYSAEHADYETAEKIHAEKKKRLIVEAAGSNPDKASVATLALEDLGPAPRRPVAPNLVAMDPTFEGLLKLFHIGRPSLGVFTDEAGGFIGGHAMNSDNRLKTMAGMSKLWDGAPVDRTRAGDGAQTFRGRRLAAHLMMQPIVARPLLADPQAAGQGFLARFLLTEPASHIGTRLRRGHSIDSERAVEEFARRLQKTLSTPLPVDDDKPQELRPRRLPLSADAKELLWQFFEHVEQRQGKGQEYERVTAFASKAPEQAARIAGVLALWGAPDVAEVCGEDMMSGVMLAQYYLNEARRLMDIASVSAETMDAENLRTWLLETWPHPEIVVREVVQKGPNRLRETSVVKEVFKTLEKNGWLVRLPEGAVVRGKARKEAFRIVRGCNHGV
ncbi:hypothetical protein BTR14_03100 [Rhizobium rhizosphaerae]|uniref:DUF3987 domain-containing protein n=1 Tax=Xaviernesmea rhizosphaerae TaxID=1672749 RepID=A0ABX3PHP8_9HYPH|nr:YfjI family protein [Xaviernesmea rhizosphaerae]OQP87572.1 hypothetical protein BTR14_03100 [Xaviernesmea rhizosphaerae]